MIQVVDASVVVAALLDRSDAGTWCLDRIAEGDLAGPHLLPFEVGSVIRRHALSGLIEPFDARRAFDELRELPVTLVSFEALADRIWELREKVTVYDASYVAVAERLGGRLVTLDRRLAAASGPRCEFAIAPDGTV